MGIKVSNGISQSAHQIFSQNPCTFLGRVSTKVVKRIVKFETLNFSGFIFFLGGWGVGVDSLTWYAMGKYKMCEILKGLVVSEQNGLKFGTRLS